MPKAGISWSGRVKGEAKEQVTIRGASGGAQESEGEDESFRVEGFAPSGVGEGLLLGELQDGAIDDVRGQGSEREAWVWGVHRVE